MYIENKSENGLVGNAKIGKVKFSKTGKSVHYDGKVLKTLSGAGFKSNYIDVETGEEYWISGCRKDGRDALYRTTVEIDEDIREEYWEKIRNLPENKQLSSIKAKSKY